VDLERGADRESDAVIRAHRMSLVACPLEESARRFRRECQYSTNDRIQAERLPPFYNNGKCVRELQALAALKNPQGV